MSPPPFLLGAPFSGGAPCAPRSEPSALTAVAWTGWWNGNNYDDATGIASGIASAGASGGRDLTSPSGAARLGHGARVGRDCAMTRETYPGTDAKHAQADVRARDFISRTGFTIYVVASLPAIEATGEGGELIFLWNNYSLQGHGVSAGGDGDSLLIGTSMYTQPGGTPGPGNGIATKYGHVVNVEPAADTLFLFETRFTYDSVSGHLFARLNNDTEVAATISGPHDWDYEEGNGIIPWSTPTNNSDDEENVYLIGRRFGEYESPPREMLGFGNFYEILITDTMLDGTTRTNVRAALMSKYSIA